MAPNPILIPRAPQYSNSHSVIQQTPLGISIPLLFGAIVCLLLAVSSWSWRWLFSGAPGLSFVLLLGTSRGYRVLPVLPLWTSLATLNLVYAIASTSWLLYGFFTMVCYPATFLACIIQFNSIASLVRRILRTFLKQVHFINDTVALFDIPALEIDTDVNGLMVIRGLTFSFTSLTLVAYGIEVGIKLSDDMELALQTEKVTISFFRKIEIDEVYANIKGGEYEMTFGKLDVQSLNSTDGQTFMVADSALLQVAAATGDTTRPPLVKMVSRMTDGAELEDVSADSGLHAVTSVSPNNEATSRQFKDILNWIQKTNLVSQNREKVSNALGASLEDTDRMSENDIRVGISTRLHSKPSVPHPPATSIRVTTLQNLAPPRVRTLLHRLPMLLRLLLSLLSYFHPISIRSIVSAGSGKWITTQLKQYIFQSYTDENSDLRRLAERILSWLSDANFVLVLNDVMGLGQVPFFSMYDIVCYLSIADIMAYRSLFAEQMGLKQVARLRGADATFSIPSFLLPHHEHLLPPVPTREDEQEVEQEVEEADGLPETVHKEKELDQTRKDETNVKLSVHGRLPACFHPELLEFVAALVKAAKLIDLEKEPSPMEEVVTGVKEFASSLHRNMKEGVKKVVVDSVVQDRWIAKVVGKIMTKLEAVQGDLGYSGDIPVALGPYRIPEGDIEAHKILA